MGEDSHLPGAAVYPAESRPRPARHAPGDDRWVKGMCWLYCRRIDVPVTWLGPAVFNGIHAPLMACEQCIAELDHMIWNYFISNTNA
ncbi:hypothetical protein GCM10028832_11520 [Streptomyces sparsus]